MKTIMNETPKDKSSWRIPRRILITLAIFATLIAIFYTEEDWRGKRAWGNYKREWEAKGEKFDWQAFVSPSVPDDQNFFTAPIFTNLVKGKLTMSTTRSDGSYPDLHQQAYWAKATMTDLKAWQTYYRNSTNTSLANEFPIMPQPQTPATDVLLALSKYDSAVDELRQASQRPYSNVPLNYENGFEALSPLLEDLTALKRCSQVLQLRAIAELADGQSAKALDDVKLLLRLSDSIRGSPFLISHLVRIAITSITLQPIWEGLAEHKWSDEQLVALDAELAKLDFLADYEFAMRGELAFAIGSFENQRRTREMIVLKDGGNSAPNKPVIVSLRFMPSAYFYQNELAFAQVQQQWILPLVDMKVRIVSPETLRRADDAVRAERKHYSPYRIQALMLFPALDAAVKKFAFAQASVDLAQVACALERYRLAHGEYPETLDALAPQFIENIPHDIIGGEPLNYRATADGKFLLYSVGWNEKDDGGQIVLKKDGSEDRETGDWVWPNPVK
jgi:tetratricopeptide (TPR) repeat protein